MKTLPDTLRKTAESFVDDVQAAFGTSLRSVVLYGPAARGETSKEPYITFLVVADDTTPSELAHCTPYLKGWRKRLVATPLFIAPDYIGRSLDTFPLEFMSMAASYHIAYGEDVLAGLSFEAADIRAQCEREIKGKLLHLRAEYLNLRGNAKGLVDLANRSLTAFRPVFLGALFLKDVPAPERTADMLDAVIKAYGLDAALFGRLTTLAGGGMKIGDTDADTLFDLYVEELDALSLALDELATGTVATVTETDTDTAAGDAENTG
jgi:hypothetical protein